MTAFTSAVTLWSRFWRSAAIACVCPWRRRGTCRSCAPSYSSARPVLTAKTKRPRKNLHYLIYRLPDGDFPEPGWSIPVGGLVVPIADGDFVKDVALQRYHCAPWEHLWFEDVSHMRAGRRQARELQWVWEIEMDAWMEAVNG